MSYHILNRELINKRRNIQRINDGFYVSSDIIKRFNISYADIKNTKYIHSNVDIKLLKSIEQTESLTQKQQEQLELKEATKTLYNIDRIKECIMSNPKDIKDTTKKQYISRINVMLKELDTLCLREALSHSEFENYILTKNETMLIISGLLLLDVEYDKTKIDQLKQELFKKKKEFEANHEPIIKKSYKELIEIRDSLRKMSNISLNYLLVALLLDNMENLYRAELYSTIISNTNNNVDNIYNQETGELYLNSFKNSHKKEHHTIKLSQQLVDDIKESLEIQPRTSLFPNITYKQFLAMVKNCLGITFQELRRIIDTERFNTNPKEYVLNSKSHSPQIGMTYYVKKPVNIVKKMN